MLYFDILVKLLCKSSCVNCCTFASTSDALYRSTASSKCRQSPSVCPSRSCCPQGAELVLHLLSLLPCKFL